MTGMKRWYGKFFGLIAGWLLFRHPAGGLLGLLVGHAFDADWFKSARDNPYGVLEVSSDATDAEVERAYRRLISQYHPDRLGQVSPLVRQLRRRFEAMRGEDRTLRRQADGLSEDWVQRFKEESAAKPLAS